MLWQMFTNNKWSLLTVPDLVDIWYLNELHYMFDVWDIEHEVLDYHRNFLPLNLRVFTLPDACS
jgi:hypothetical protein